MHIDTRALAEDRGRLSELADGAALHPETVRRLSCDAAVVAMLDDADAVPLDVGRRRRTVNAALRRALRARDAGCRFPGCIQRRHVDAHHITHWAHGGQTALANLILLCRAHHRLLHEGGFRLDINAVGGPVFTRPDSQPVPDAPAARLGPPLRAPTPDADLGPIAGGRLDLPYVVWVLCHRADRILDRAGCAKSLDAAAA